MIETSTPEEVIAILEKKSDHLIGIDGIDGIDGSGKSTLAGSIASKGNFAHINLDSFVNRNQGQYVKHINCEAVRQQIDRAEKPVVIEGACLLAIVENLELSLDSLIYVKRLNDIGTWRDQDRCDTQDIDGFLEKEKQRFERGKILFGEKQEATYPQFAEEVTRYHHKFKPHLKADIIYKRSYG